jgi:hypothetical protein
MSVEEVGWSAEGDDIPFSRLATCIVKAYDLDVVKAFCDPDVSWMKVTMGISMTMDGKDLLQQHLQDGDSMQCQEIFSRHQPLELEPQLPVDKDDQVVVLENGHWSAATPDAFPEELGIAANLPED